MRRPLFSLLCLLSLSACHSVSPLQSARISTQAYLPPDAYQPTPNPCVKPPFQSRAYLPPDANNPKPNPCPCQHGYQARAALPPDLNPGHPSYPSYPGQPSNPNCRP